MKTQLQKRAGVFYFCLLACAVTLLGACADKAFVSETKKWKDFEIYFETRPATVQSGMMEFLVIANQNGRRAADRFVVSLRVGEIGPWAQAIQDGQTGVYRRAAMVRDPLHDKLFIHIRYKDEETLLEYPLIPKDK